MELHEPAMDSQLSKMLTANVVHNPLLLGMDLKEMAKIERKREVEELRRKRIFNTKNRLIGVDVPTLNKQKWEKANKERIEQLDDDKQALLAKRLADMAIAEENREISDKKQICRSIDDYRMIHQKREHGRDYDLEKGVPATESKIGGDDERFGVTIFEGEDDNLKDRIKQQQLQLKSWLLLQMREKDTTTQALENKDKLYYDTYNERDRRSMELERMEAECRLKMERAIAEFNVALAEKNAHDREKQRCKETQWNNQEMLNAVTSDLMQENPNLSKSSLGPTRCNTMMYKGMSPDMINEIRSTQQKQREEKKARATKEQYEMKSWDRYNSYVLDVSSRVNKETEQLLQNQRKELEDFNQQLGKRQRQVEKYKNNVTYANNVTEDFFNQFNKGSR